MLGREPEPGSTDQCARWAGHKAKQRVAAGYSWQPADQGRSSFRCRSGLGWPGSAPLRWSWHTW